MDKDEKAVEKEVEETTQDDSPTSETPETEQEKTEAPEDQTEKEDLPESEEERRKAFQKYRMENKQLRDELDKRKQTESSFDSFRPQAQPQGVDINQYADPNTGQVNWQAYNSAVANQAKAEAREAAVQELDEFKARQKHPDLFADSRIEKRIASEWFFENMVRGNKVSIEKIADEISKDYEKSTKKAEKAGADKMLTEVSQKEQASASASTTTSSARQSIKAEELENLRQMSRGKGRTSEAAIAERLKGIPYQ